MYFKIFSMTVAFAALTSSQVGAAGTNAPRVTLPPQGEYVCSDTMYCAPQKRSGETCVMDNECLSELCQGYVCVPGSSLEKGSSCMWDDDCLPGLACENMRCQ